MNSFFKTLIAGYGAKKLGGGCLSTIVIFVIIYFLLGQCNGSANGKTNNEPTITDKTVVITKDLKPQ